MLSSRQRPACHSNQAERLAVAQIVGVARGEGEGQRLVAVGGQHTAFRRLFRGVLKRSGLPERCSLAELHQAAGITTRVEPVGDVATPGEAPQLHDADAGGDPMQAGGDLLRMAAAGVVAVRQNADREIPEMRVQLDRPLVGAAGVAGGDEAEAC